MCVFCGKVWKHVKKRKFGKQMRKNKKNAIFWKSLENVGIFGKMKIVWRFVEEILKQKTFFFWKSLKILENCGKKWNILKKWRTGGPSCNPKNRGDLSGDGVSGDGGFPQHFPDFSGFFSEIVFGHFRAFFGLPPAGGEAEKGPKMAKHDFQKNPENIFFY